MNYRKNYERPESHGCLYRNAMLADRRRKIRIRVQNKRVRTKKALEAEQPDWWGWVCGDDRVGRPVISPVRLLSHVQGPSWVRIPTQLLRQPLRCGRIREKCREGPLQILF